MQRWEILVVAAADCFAVHNFIFFLKDDGNALIVVPCCVSGKFNCLDFMHVLCFAAGACLKGARSCSPVM
jgi:hypothetical protein